MNHSLVRGLAPRRRTGRHTACIAAWAVWFAVGVPMVAISAAEDDSLPAPSAEPAVTVVAEAPVVGLATMDGPPAAHAYVRGDLIDPFASEPARAPERPAEPASAAGAAASADAFRAAYADAMAERESLRDANGRLASQRNALAGVVGLVCAALLVRLARGDQVAKPAAVGGRVPTARVVTARSSASDRIRFASDAPGVDRSPVVGDRAHAVHGHAPVAGGR